MFLGKTLLLATLADYLADKLPQSDRVPSAVFDRPFADVYDYVVVGGGSAGCVVAARLSEDCDSTVLLLEAGGSDVDNENTQIPYLVTRNYGSESDWGYNIAPQRYSHYAYKNRQTSIPRGKVLGGSGSINGMSYVRGSRFDYDKWASEGATGWSYKDVLPYFKKLETVNINGLQDTVFRGHHGPINVIHGYTTPLQFFHEQAGREAGFPEVDCNGNSSIGFCRQQKNIKNGVRCSSSSCLLRPALGRRNLQVSLNSHVIKVNIVRGLAQGVTFIKHGRRLTVRASREVIMSAGTIGSPHILLLSGIGPKHHLKRFGVPVKIDLPVGNNLQDHMVLNFQYNTNVSLNMNDEKIRDPERIFQYILHKEGAYTGWTGDGNMFLKLDNRSWPLYPNVQLLFRGIAYESPVESYREEVIREHKKIVSPVGFQVFLFMLHPKSCGRIRLRSTHPFDDPVIDPRFLSNTEDVDVFLSDVSVGDHPSSADLVTEKKIDAIGLKCISIVLRFMQILENTPSWKSIGTTFVRHDVDGHCKEIKFNTTDYWRCVIVHFASSGWHHVGTCRMGLVSDPEAVVDPSLKVKGVPNLRVVDASVMPDVPSGNTNVPAMMIAEKASDIIKWDNRNK